MKSSISILACFTILSCSPVSNSTSEKTVNYKIAYNVLYDAEADDYEVFVMNMDGSGKKNISNWKGVDWVYYAFGDKLYFISDRDTCHRCYFLYEMDADGNNIRKISDIRLQDSWLSSRKNGTELIVNPRIPGKDIFYIIDTGGKLLDSLVVPLEYVNDPAFSPDGRQIVFRGSKERPSKERTEFDELYLINADGSNLQQLTYYPAGDTTADWHSYHAGPPRWNARQNIITYQSKQKGKYTLFAIRPDGSGQRRLLQNTVMNEGWHDWSPDGKWLAVEMFNDLQKRFAIFLVNAETQEMRQLTNGITYEQAPVFVLPALP